jgi:predicted esterase
MIEWFWIILILSIIAAAILVYVAWQGGSTITTRNPYNPPPIHSETEKTGIWKKMGTLATPFIVLISLICLVATVLLAFVVVRTVEQQNLYCPTTTERYKRITGDWIALKSGGGVMHCTPLAQSNARRLLFLHGNTGDLDLYDAALRKCAEEGYDIYAIEYAGFGIAAQRNGKTKTPDSESVLNDVMEAWSVLGNERAIIMGFSIGAAILCQVYDKLRPMPAQLVFLNGFHSTPGLVASKFGDTASAIIGPLMANQWQTRPPQYYRNRVLIVYTMDDEVVTPQQGMQLCRIFSALHPDCVALPSGGHRYSTINHIDVWATPQHLLPAFPEPTLTSNHDTNSSSISSSSSSSSSSLPSIEGSSAA